MPILLLEGLLLLAMISIAIAIIFGKNLLAATIILLWIQFQCHAFVHYSGCGRRSFTEAIIGTISTVYFIIAIKSIKNRGEHDEKK